MTITPIIALDIDGVLSPIMPFGKTLPEDSKNRVWADDQYIMSGDKGGAVPAGKPVLDFLKNISDSHRAIIRWNTSWQDMAFQLGEDFGLPEWDLIDPSLKFFNDHSLKFNYKWLAVKEKLDAGHKVIWLDDDMQKWKKNKTIPSDALNYENLFTIVPDSKKGLEQKHLDLIDSKLSEWGD